MLSAVVVAVLVAAFLLVAGVAGWVVWRLWTASGDGAEHPATPARVTEPTPEG